MSESYTVSEAADILGIASERIWELVARGVLAGESQADGSYRVRLKPDPAPVAEGSTSHARPANGNGNGDPSFEWRAFRELLTEFRTLTERYGQALLALGEARGEVAALRGRVEQLETRMEVRPPASHVAAWQASRPDDEDLPATEAEAAPEVEPEPDVATEPEPRAHAQPEPVVTGADLEAEPPPALEAEPPPALEAEPPPAVETEPEPVTVRADVGREPEPGYADLAAEPETSDSSELPEAQADLAPHEPEPGEAPAETRASFAIADEDVRAEPPEAFDERWPVEEPEPTEEGTRDRQRVIRRHRLAATLRRRQRARSAAMAGFAQALARAEDPTTQLLPAGDIAGEVLEIEPAEAHEEAEAAAAAAEEIAAPDEPWTPPSAEAEELELEMGGWQAPTEPERQAESVSAPEPESVSEPQPVPEPEFQPDAEQPAAARDDSELRAYMSASMPDDVDPIEWVERILSPSISRAPQAPLAEERVEEPEPVPVPGEPSMTADSEEEAPADQATGEDAPELDEPARARPLAQLPGIADLETALDELRRSSQSAYSEPQREAAHREAPQREEPPWQEATADDGPVPADERLPGDSHQSTFSAEGEYDPPAPYRASALLIDDAEFRRRLLEPGDPDWLRGRRGPAASAYRRLRRIFPG